MKKLFKASHFFYATQLIAIFTFFTIKGFSQELQVAKGKIYTSDGREILFTNLVQSEINVSYENGMYINTLTNDQVAQIDKEIGNEAGKWALYLGVSGLIGSALGVAQSKAETGLSNSSLNTQVILGITGVFTGIGALIGYGKKKYETIYTNPKYGLGDFLKNSSVDFTISDKNSFIFSFRHTF
jgi:hypothetical protein